VAYWGVCPGVGVVADAAARVSARNPEGERPRVGENALEICGLRCRVANGGEFVCAKRVGGYCGFGIWVNPTFVVVSCFLLLEKDSDFLGKMWWEAVNSGPSSARRGLRCCC